MPTIESRLEQLAIDMPPDLAARALAAARQAPLARPRPHRARPHSVYAVAAIALVLVANVAVLKSWPAYGRALADAPGASWLTEPILRGTGLVPSDVVLGSDTARSAHHTLRLVGGYADSERTVVFVEIDGVVGQNGAASAAYAIGRATLSDQVGHEYNEPRGSSTGGAGRARCRTRPRREVRLRVQRAGCAEQPEQPPFVPANAH